MTRPWMKEDGFSLTELTIALVILAIVSGLAFTAFRSVILPQRAQQAAREIGSLLRAAQQTATANAAGFKCVGVVITSTTAIVRTIPSSDTAIDCANPVAAAFTGATFVQSGDFPNGISVSVTPGGGTGIVTFLPTGASCTGSNCATSIAITGGSSTRRVCITAGTGLVQIVENASCP